MKELDDWTTPRLDFHKNNIAFWNEIEIELRFDMIEKEAMSHKWKDVDQTVMGSKRGLMFRNEVTCRCATRGHY